MPRNDQSAARERVEVRLVRTRGGSMIHRVDCRYAGTKGAYPWVWAGGKTHGEIRSAVLQMRISVCHVCRPTDGRGVIPW